MKKRLVRGFMIVLMTLIVSPFSLRAQDEEAQNADHLLEIGNDINNYAGILKELELSYVDTIDYVALTKAGIGYMLNGLDPYTVYYGSDEFDQLQRLRSGEYGGIGAVIMRRNNKAYINEPYEGMPAQQNDVRAGDEIIEIDGTNVQDLAIAQVSKLLRGTPGSTIVLKLKRKGHKGTIKRSFERKLIEMPTIPYYGNLNDTVGVICINDFVDRTSQLFREALDDMVKNSGVKRLVIDLRGNGGGIINQAVDIISLFVPYHTEIVTLKGRYKKGLSSYTTQQNPVYPKMPLVILVDGNTASSSEIMSGALQDLDRAVIMGSRTYGKGLVQSVKEVPEGYLKVTIAKYYIPSGRCIQALDYSKRDKDGKVQEVPDSLTSVFYTANLRPVRDGRGILPDVIYEAPNGNDILYFLYKDYYFMDYALEYLANHPSIAPAKTFALSDEDYQGFCDFVTDSKFTYKLTSDKYLNELKKVIKEDGREEETKEAVAQLSALLQPNIPSEMQEYRAEISAMLETEIVQRRYFQKGKYAYYFTHDQEVKDALTLIMDYKKYNAILDGSYKESSVKAPSTQEIKTMESENDTDHEPLEEIEE